MHHSRHQSRGADQLVVLQLAHAHHPVPGQRLQETLNSGSRNTAESRGHSKHTCTPVQLLVQEHEATLNSFPETLEVPGVSSSEDIHLPMTPSLLSRRDRMLRSLREMPPKPGSIRLLQETRGLPDSNLSLQRALPFRIQGEDSHMTFLHDLSEGFCFGRAQLNHLITRRVLPSHLINNALNIIRPFRQRVMKESPFRRLEHIDLRVNVQVLRIGVDGDLIDGSVV